MAHKNKFTEAKQAARVFLDSAPKDVYVGIVTFAKQVTVAQQPSLDRAASKAIIDNLTLQRSTHLYDGVKQAVKASGTDGQRSILLLSDGRDTTSTPLASVTKAVRDAEVKVDAVALAQSAPDRALLQQIADSGSGAVISANDPAALSGVFKDEATTLAKQILISVKTPPDLVGAEGSLTVSIDAGKQTFTDRAYVTLGGEGLHVDERPAVDGPDGRPADGLQHHLRP